MRDHPAAFDYRNYFPVDNRAHAAAFFQVNFERAIKAISVEFSQWIQER